MQLWAIPAEGGYMYSDELSNVLRMAVQPATRFRQLCDAKDATDKGLGAGENFSWNVYTKVLQGGGQLTEDNPIPKTKYKIDQMSLTVAEFGNSVPYSSKLDNLSKQPVTDVINKVLKNDCVETLDGYAYNEFKASPLKVQAASGTHVSNVVVVDSGSIGVTNNVALRAAHIKAISDAMKERNIPAYQDSDYVAVAWPTTLRTFKNDLEAVHSYVDQGFRMILAGEIGRYEGIRFVEQTHIKKGGAEDSTTYDFRTADPWNNAVSDWCFFMGEDTVAEAICIPEEIRGKIPTDFGRDKGVAWYYLGGFGIVHGSAGQRSNCRIMRWESAA